MARGRRTGIVAAAAGLALVLALGGDGPAPPEAPVRPHLQFTPGARQAYRLSVESVLHFAGGPEPGGAAPSAIHQSITATLHVRVLDAGPDGARVALQLAGASARLQGQASPELDRQLGRLFLVTFAPDGRAARFELPPAAGPEARAVLEEAVRTFEVIVPADAGSTWSAEEEHGAGRYRATYRLTGDGRIPKVKAGYLRAGPAGGPPDTGARVAVRRSDATARLADDGGSWLERMVVDEELTAALGQGLVTTSTLRAELVAVPVEPGAGLELDAPGASLGGPPAPSAGAPSAAAAPLEGLRPLATVVSDLDARRGRSAALLYELRKLLLRDPALAAELLALLRRGQADGTAAALINALGMAATPEAQAALREVVADPALGRMNRLRALLALGGGTDLDDPTLAALRSAADGRRADGLADTAVLALGMAAETLRRDDPERYGPVRDDLVARARSGGDPAASALLALGNTRDPALAEVAAARLDDPSAAARAAAARALGKLPGGADPEQLARRLAVEQDPGVRGALASALAGLPAPTATALALARDAIVHERDADARFVLVRFLGEHLDVYPAGRDALAALATQDPSRRIRQHAAHVVWGGGT